MRTSLKLAVTGIAAALVLTACSSGDAEPEESSTAGGGDEMMEFAEGSTMAALSEAGTITIGTKFDQPLFGLVGPDGVPEGFDVEIGKLIASKLGIAEGDIEWIETVSANREPFIEGGQVDIVVATYTINDARKEIVSFAGPYYVAGQALMVLSDNDDITSPDDLAGKNVCSVEGSTPAQYITDNYPDATLVTFAAYTDCLEPLRNGQVDVVTTDNVILAGYVADSDGEFKIAGEQFTEEPYGIGLALEDDEFRSWINDVLEEAIDDGSWLDAWNATAGEVLGDPVVPTIDRY